MPDDLSPGAPVPGDTGWPALDASEAAVRRRVVEGPRAPAPGRRKLTVFLAEYDRLRAIVSTLPGGQSTTDAHRDGAAGESQLPPADGPVLDGVHAIALGSIARDLGLTAEASGALVALTVADRMEELERLREELAVVSRRAGHCSGKLIDPPCGYCGSDRQCERCELIARSFETYRLRQQRDAALALHRNDTSGAAAPPVPGMCEVCMHEWPCPTAHALGVEEGTDV